MLEVARTRALEQGVGITFRTGDAQSLEFADRSFDATVSLRVLMHAPRWRECISELCRVSDQLVIVDYPASRSVAVLQSAWRRVIHAFGVRTEPYRVFSHGDIEDAFKKAGFGIRSAHKQFVLPIALHKAINSRRFTLATENILESVGLRSIVGSPVTLVAERCGPS
jgi:ubiquinone/menaquinone biosynthesis C-methylase UbiE